MNLSGNIIVIINFQLEVNRELDNNHVTKCWGITKDSNENDYLLMFDYATLGDLHNNLSKNFKKITWMDKIESLGIISEG